jgi:hypothetical protein
MLFYNVAFNALRTRSSNSKHHRSKPELGGYWFFVILTGVDIMDEYKIMEIRVYI